MRFLAHLVIGFLFLSTAAFAKDPLPSWRDTPNKAAIVSFVRDVTTPKSRFYVKKTDRIAVFDNDGTLWVEQPIYTQITFVLDRIASLAPEHPEWKERQPFQAALARDLKTLGSLGLESLAELIAASQTGVSLEEFQTLVSSWLRTAQHPTLKRPYDRLVYQPMLELMDYLRAHGFKVFIVTGGGVEFVRANSEKTYGVATEQVVGSRLRQSAESVQDRIEIVTQGTFELVDDHRGKPLGIVQQIGKRPIFAFGNSDGDYAMLQWTTEAAGKRFGGIVHHDDALREFAYDRNSSVGRLDKALDDAARRGWKVISMKNDWRRIFPQSR